ncbi:MAG: LytR/AlgR family response regulator transcription factor [Trueperaceae bacterium]
MSKTMTILIAEDEEHTRAELRYLLVGLEPEAEILESDDGLETIQLVNDRAVDVLFLDINMPGESGLNIAATLMDKPKSPLIIFGTAYSQHALKAFELAAIDYLVKPYREMRLRQTLDRVRQLLGQRETEQPTRYPAEPTTKQINKLWAVRDEEVGVLLDYKDILWFEADDKRVFVQSLASEKLLVRYTMRELEERLTAHQFARTHKSYLVNLEHVHEIEPWFSGTYLLRLDDEAKSKVPLSRQFAKQLKEVMGWF